MSKPSSSSFTVKTAALFPKSYFLENLAVGLPDNHIDGFTELWFDDLSGLAGVFQSQNYSKQSGRMRRSFSTCTLVNSRLE